MTPIPVSIHGKSGYLWVDSLRSESVKYDFRAVVVNQHGHVHLEDPDSMVVDENWVASQGKGPQ